MALTIFPRVPTSFIDSAPLRVNGGHPLARHLVGVWVCGPGGGDTQGTQKVRELLYGQDAMQDIAAAHTTGHVASVVGGGLIGGHIVSGSISARMKRVQQVSLVWFGVIKGGHIGGNAAYFAGTNFGGGGSPFAAYTMYRDSDDTTLGFQWNTAGSFASMTVANGITTADYNLPLMISATWGIGSVRGYKNGRHVATGTGVTSITYNSNAEFGVGADVNAGALSGDGNYVTSLVLLYGCELTPTDHMLLALNPFQVFIGRNVQASGLGSGGGGVTGASRLVGAQRIKTQLVGGVLA